MIIKYSVFTLFLIASIILFFVGLLNGGANADVYNAFHILMLMGLLGIFFMVLIICFSLMEDF